LRYLNILIYIKPGVIGIRNGTRINSQEEDEEEEEIDKSSNLIENNKGPKQKISAFLGVIQLPPGAAINIKERTKVKNEFFDGNF